MKSLDEQLHELRGMWRQQIYEDGKLTHAAFRVGYGLADYMTMKDTKATYKKTGKIEVFPTQEKLSAASHVVPATVHNSIAQLIKRGHLEQIGRGNQFSGANHYRILIKSRSEQ